MVDQRFSTSVHIMTALAFEKCQDGVLMTSDELAKSCRTNATVVRRLVARLVDAKLLKAYKGKTGGIELARKADKITLKDIYVASAGKTLIQIRRKNPRKVCPVSCSMSDLMSGIVDGVENNSMRYLATISLASLVSKVK